MERAPRALLLIALQLNLGVSCPQTSLMEIIPLHPWVVLALLATALSSASEAQVVRGVVRDSISGLPAPQLWVAVQSQDTQRYVGGVRTDSTGAFEVKVPLAAVYRIEFSLPDGTRLDVDSVGVTASAMETSWRQFALPLTEAETRHMYYGFQVDRPATVRHAPPLQFPEEARARGASGEVLLQVAVDSLGSPVPGSIHLLRSPDPALEQAARAAIMQVEFEPARLKGRPVRQLVQIPFIFSAH